MSKKWSEREYQAFKDWEKKFDRPMWWLLGVAVGMPTIGVLLGAMTK
jgi:hypothetical protein